jgi:DNA-binding IclR family transcriptional regulator
MIRQPAVEKSRLKTEDGERSPKNANRSVGVGLSVLKAIADIGRSASLSEIARAAHMPASRTHRFLAGMVQVGAVRQDSATGRYDLGPLMVDLGVAALGRVDGVKLGTDALRELTEKTGLVSVLVIWSTNGPTVIRWENGELATAVRIREGQSLSLLRTASGKIFLANLPAEKTRALVATELASPEHRASASSLRSLEDVERLKLRIRADGIADNPGESNYGIVGMAAPVFGPDGALAMAMAIIGVNGIAALSRDSTACAALRDTAAAVTRSLGGRPGAGRTLQK